MFAPFDSGSAARLGGVTKTYGAVRALDDPVAHRPAAGAGGLEQAAPQQRALPARGSGTHRVEPSD